VKHNTSINCIFETIEDDIEINFTESTVLTYTFQL